MAKKTSINIIIPVYNEQEDLPKSMQTLHAFMSTHMRAYDWNITIADNASVDNTLKVSQNLSKKLSHTKVIHLNQKGRGRAVKYAWENCSHDYVMYMDVDLSTDLKHIPQAIASLERGYDIAIGTRNARASRVYGRNLLRTFTSRTYIFLIKLFFWVGFSDAQCGFKAANRRVVCEIIPNIKDNEWFFDTELLIVSERLGYRIYEEPVTWVDNPGSTVKVWKTAQGDLEGLMRLFFTRPWHKLPYARG